MTASAPIDRTRSAFLVLHTPVTWAPSALAIWTANVPTPPDAPLTRTFCPGCTWAASRSACRAPHAAVGTPAACSKVIVGGFGTTLSRGARVLGEGAGDIEVGAGSEDLVARVKIRDLRTDLGDRAGNVRPSDTVPRSPKFGAEAGDVRDAPHDDAVSQVEASRVHADQHVLLPDDRFVDLLRGENIRRPVPVLDDRLHGALLVRRASHGDDDLASGVSLLQRPDGLGHLAQRVGPVDDRCDLAGLDELLQDHQVLAPFLQYELAQPLAHERRQHGRPEDLAIEASEPPSAPFASHDDERPPGGEGAPSCDRERFPRGVEDQVIALHPVREVLAR